LNPIAHYQNAKKPSMVTAAPYQQHCRRQLTVTSLARAYIHYQFLSLINIFLNSIVIHTVIYQLFNMWENYMSDIS